jgi:hypothetical protein
LDVDAVLSQSFEAVLDAVVIGTWAAFETLAGDLWEEALNAHPDRLSSLEGKETTETKNSIARARGEEGSARTQDDRKEKDNPRAIRLDLLGKFGFDLGKVMGKILRDRFAFSRLEDVRMAYVKAFRYEAEGKLIVDCLNSDALDCLSAVRNVIVHKSGRADGSFRIRIGSDVRFQGTKVDDPVVLDGGLVKSLVDPAVGRAVELCRLVDLWLERN